MKKNLRNSNDSQFGSCHQNEILSLLNEKNLSTSIFLAYLLPGTPGIYNNYYFLQTLRFGTVGYQSKKLLLQEFWLTCLVFPPFQKSGDPTVQINYEKEEMRDSVSTWLTQELNYNFTTHSSLFQLALKISVAFHKIVKDLP